MLLISPALSVLQKCYELVGSGNEIVRATKKGIIDFRLLMALSSLNRDNINKFSSNIMLCSYASFTDRAALYCLFERFHELQRSLFSNAYNALKRSVNVSDVE